MKVFLVIIEDSHTSNTDVEVLVFSEKESAVQAAKDIVQEYDYEPEEPYSPVDRWIFDAPLSDEGDFVRVEAAEVDRVICSGVLT